MHEIWAKNLKIHKELSEYDGRFLLLKLHEDKIENATTHFERKMEEQRQTLEYFKVEIEVKLMKSLVS